MAEQHRFGNIIGPITCHAWNKDRSKIAFSPNNHEVHIYKRVGQDWKREDVLNQHDLRVMGIDWAPNSNRIVTCSADRNAYVWTLGDDDKWKTTLVLLRINRAATCVKWSPTENKFAVGSGARLISVCYFEAENDWWVSKHIKKPIRSTITSLDWHPNNVLLVVGSADYKIRIFSAFIKDIETATEPTAWGQKHTLGHVLAEFPNSTAGGGWVHSVSFSPDGNKVCWVAHDSSINVVDVTRSNAVCKLRTEYLPFLKCLWTNNTSVVAAGHGCIPVLYKLNADGQLVFSAKLDAAQKRETSGISAMKKFQSLDKQARADPNDTNLDSLHQNAITSLNVYSKSGSNVMKFSTAGLDGQMIIWDVVSLEKAVAGMKVD